MNFRIYDLEDGKYKNANFEIRHSVDPNLEQKFYVEFTTNKLKGDGSQHKPYYIFGIDDSPEGYSNATDYTELFHQWLAYVFGDAAFANPSSNVGEGTIGAMIIG